MGQKVFVTVGTTKFDKLVETISSSELVLTLSKLGYEAVAVQLGEGSRKVRCGILHGLQFDVYDFKDSIKDDIISADLVISHAGAGSVLETLGCGKPLIVVINEDLMGNHQIELAKKMAEEGYLFYCTCSTLKETLLTMDLKSLKPLPPVDGTLFAEYVDELMGIS